MADSFDIDKVRETIARLMARDGIKRKPLAKAAGLGETAIRDIFDDKRNDVRVGTLFKIADYFGVTIDEISGRNDVPLLGKVGAGGMIAFDEDGERGFVARPPLAGGDRLIALEVCGDSMLPKHENGDVIYVRRDHDGILPHYLGQYCAVALVDGGVYLKVLSAGSKPSRYTLRSLNAADMENVEVLWASPVLFVMPRLSRSLT